MLTRKLTLQSMFILVVTLVCVSLLVFYKYSEPMIWGYTENSPRVVLSNWFQLVNVSAPASTPEESNEFGTNVTSENKTRRPTWSTPAPSTESPKNQVSCKLPQLPVDDPLIRPYLKELGPLQCTQEKNWVYTMGDGKFYIDQDAIRRHGPVSCEYFRVDRLNETEYTEISLGPIQNGSDLNGDIFRIQCFGKDDNSTYENIHVSVPYPKQELLDRIRNASDRLSERLLDLNIFVYMMDSVSRMNFIRKLPKFYKLLTQVPLWVPKAKPDLLDFWLGLGGWVISVGLIFD